MKNSHFAFFSPPLLGASTYTIHLRLIRKLVVDFLIVLIERFSLGLVLQLWLRCYERILSVNRLF